MKNDSRIVLHFSFFEYMILSLHNAASLFGVVCMSSVVVLENASNGRYAFEFGITHEMGGRASIVSSFPIPPVRLERRQVLVHDLSNPLEKRKMTDYGVLIWRRGPPTPTG